MVSAGLQALRDRLEGPITAATGLSWESWTADVDARAIKVKLWRDYAEGEHRAKLTPEMRNLLRIAGPSTDESSPFSLNHMEKVITSMSDRLHLTAVEGDNEAATKWAAEIMEVNRVDGLQIDMHEAALRDGEAYILAYWDDAEKRVVWSEEYAFDGSDGIIAIYKTGGRSVPAIALKVWNETTTTAADTLRVNVYYPDRVEKFKVLGSAVEEYKDDATDAWPLPWKTSGLNGKPLGVPFAAFKNRGKNYARNGRSEIAQVVTAQDGINRTLTSMVMASELTAFQIRIAKGFDPPAGVAPGMWIIVGEDVDPANPSEVEHLKASEVGVLPAGQIQPFIDELQFLIDQIYMISGTPRADMGGAGASGEALKMLESQLLGKIRRAHVNFGNAWEDLLGLSAQIEAAYGTNKPATARRYYARWESAEVRNSAEVVKNVKEVEKHLDDQTILELLAQVFGFDDAKIEKIMKAKAAQRATEMEALVQTIPGYGNGSNPDRFGDSSNKPPVEPAIEKEIA